MLKNHARRFIRKLFILLVVTIPLLVTSTSPVGKKAAAIPCEECESNYSACLDSCEPCTSAALAFCENRYNRCLASCSR
jgi:hypothetical protein